MSFVNRRKFDANRVAAMKQTVQIGGCRAISWFAFEQIKFGHFAVEKRIVGHRIGSRDVRTALGGREITVKIGSNRVNGNGTHLRHRVEIIVAGRLDEGRAVNRHGARNGRRRAQFLPVGGGDAQRVRLVKFTFHPLCKININAKVKIRRYAVGIDAKKGRRLLFY